MRLFLDPASTSFSFLRNALVLCGLLFLNGVLGPPLEYLWGIAILENRIFTGTTAIFLSQFISVVPHCVVALESLAREMPCD